MLQFLTIEYINMINFRFMNLEIWKISISLNDQLFDIADKLEESKKYRVAEQLRGASLSISNNIAEGSGSFSQKEFSHFLNISRRSVFEVVNILVIVYNRNIIDEATLNSFLESLDALSRKITNFRKSILKNSE